MAYMTQHRLDARKVLCPLPVIRTQDKVLQLSKGDVLTVYCTDPGATNDIPAWCRINGHKVLSIDHNREDISITIEVDGLGT
jgi:tRNA 2-thiouridine synthesizing protein A